MARVSVISGVGSYLPARVVTNEALSQTLDTTPAWIVERTGIHQRHIAAPEELTSDLAYAAAVKALKAASLPAEKIDLILLATATPDHTFPATATRLQQKLGNRTGYAFDIAAVCSGFIFALATADAYLRQGLAQTALVVGAETMSRLLDWQDRRTAILFGDGAGAVVLQATPTAAASASQERGILGSLLRADGEGYDQLYVSGGPSTTQTAGTIEMNGREVFKQATQRLSESAAEILARHHLTIDELDWFIPHQANRRIIDVVAGRLGLPEAKIIHTGAMHSNTSSASIPLALDHAIQEGRVRPGHLVLCAAFGAGFTWGASLIRL